MEIIWSKKAVETFEANIDYLKAQWSEKEVRKFTTRVFHYLDLLTQEPFIARKTYKTKHTYIGIIIPHIAVVYRVKPASNLLEVVTFLDNRRSLKKNNALL